MKNPGQGPKKRWRESDTHRMSRISEPYTDLVLKDGGARLICFELVFSVVQWRVNTEDEEMRGRDRLEMPDVRSEI